MKKSIQLVLFLLVCLFGPGRMIAQWRVDTILVRSLCDERGGKGGQIQLHVSGMPGPYTYAWSTGSTGDSIMNVAAGLYSVTISNTSGKDTTLVLALKQWLCDPEPGMVFTPNGDGIHDTWFIANSQYYPDMLVAVYNRWGQLVWQHKGEYAPWDGTSYLGLPLDGNTYYYVIYEVASDKGQGIVKGSVTIIR
jgi:gliding motility-associated-like protein